MDLARLFLVLSTLSFLVALGYTGFVLGAGRHRSGWANMAVMAVGFAFQSAFLYLRGQAHGRCPITNVFEILIFVSWATVLLYFLVGPAYRLSLLGVFTAPMVLVFQIVALVVPSGLVPPPAPSGPVDFWLEVHASVSLVAYGAFALACVAGVMFLVQNRFLKTHHLNNLFYNLPSVSYLAKALIRLIVLGFVLLTGGIASAYGMESMPGGLKLSLTYAVWAVYGVVLCLYYFRGLSANHLAQASVAVFILPVASIWILTP